MIDARTVAGLVRPHLSASVELDMRQFATAGSQVPDHLSDGLTAMAAQLSA